MLAEISTLAKSDPASAEQKLKIFVNSQFPRLNVTSVVINNSKISLNSTNGFLKTPTGEYFFKFHTEEGEAISLKNSEYYQAEKLSASGLPIIKPLFTSATPGRQFLIYPKITAPTAFEEFEKLETRYLENKTYDQVKLEQLLAAEETLLKKQFQVFKSSLTLIPSTDLKPATINQLFINRLVSKNGATPRLDLYYTPNPFFRKIANLKWRINGRLYKKSLNQLITQAQQLLNPLATSYTPAVLGHGDDHNGNKFFINNEFVLFDSAFAGYHHALLSFVKATVHNVFVHPFWLYAPAKTDKKVKLSVQLFEDTIEINHNWDLKTISPLRLQIFELQKHLIWIPLIGELKSRGMLQPNWQAYLQSALFCCPFLVKNLLLEPQPFLPLAKTVELSALKILQ